MEKVLEETTFDQVSSQVMMFHSLQMKPQKSLLQDFVLPDYHR